MSNFKELYTQDYKGSYTIFQQVMTNHIWLERFLGSIDELDVNAIGNDIVDLKEKYSNIYDEYNQLNATVTQMNVVLTSLENSFDSFIENTFENLVKATPTNLALENGKLVLQHDGVTLSGQEGVEIASDSGALLFDLPDLESIPGGFRQFIQQAQATDVVDKVVVMVYENEYYYFADNQSSAGYLNFSHTGYNNGKQYVKTLTYTISTEQWTLTSDVVEGVKRLKAMFDVEPTNVNDLLNLTPKNTFGFLYGSVKEVWIRGSLGGTTFNTRLMTSGQIFVANNLLDSGTYSTYFVDPNTNRTPIYVTLAITTYNTDYYVFNVFTNSATIAGAVLGGLTEIELEFIFE